MKILIQISFFLLLAFANIDSVYSQIYFDIESGKVFSGYNDVKIPGDEGTEFSFSKDLSTESKIFLRARVSYKFSGKHLISILYAPLKLNANGEFKSAVRFTDEIFNPNEKIEGDYRFDSYRITYNYGFINNENFKLGLGLTGKIRDAEISLSDENNSSSKTNTGFVPLINLIAEIYFTENISFLVEGDGLVAPQGRAEDFLFALTYSLNENLKFKAGYRILEGGADNDEVYNFTLLNYAAFGVIFSL